MTAKMHTVQTALLQWNLELWPPTVAKVHALGAMLKLGGFRSSANYLYAYRTEADRHGCPFGPCENRALRDAIRSCERGQGAAKQAAPLPTERLRELPGGRDPWVPMGPLSPRNCLVVGTWFLCRESELAGTRAALVEVTGSQSGGDYRAIWSLPSSKTDAKAAGVTGCITVSAKGVCPESTAWCTRWQINFCSCSASFRAAGQKANPRLIYRCFQDLMAKRQPKKISWKRSAKQQLS